MYGTIKISHYSSTFQFIHYERRTHSSLSTFLHWPKKVPQAHFCTVPVEPQIQFLQEALTLYWKTILFRNQEVTARCDYCYQNDSALWPFLWTEHENTCICFRCPWECTLARPWLRTYSYIKTIRLYCTQFHQHYKVHSGFPLLHLKLSFARILAT